MRKLHDVWVVIVLSVLFLLMIPGFAAGCVAELLIDPFRILRRLPQGGTDNSERHVWW